MRKCTVVRDLDLASLIISDLLQSLDAIRPTLAVCIFYPSVDY